MNFKNNAALFTVLLIVFVDILGFTIMIPLLPFYAESLGATPFVVGMLTSIYGLCALIAGPILGELSDRFGRRIILLSSQIGTCLGYIILALSNTLWVVFLARIIDGITAGNITVVQAYISDVTEPKNRTHAMGLIGAAFGLGFILGPAISGVLVHFGHAAPIWASAILSFVSVVGTSLFLKDVRRNHDQQKEKGFTRQLSNYWKLFNSPVLKECFSLFFIFSLAFSLYMSGLALYCERILRWNGHPFTAKEVGLLLSYVGVIALSIQIFFMGKMVRKLGEVNIMLLGFSSTGIALLIVGMTPLLSLFLAGITLNTFGNAILRPSISGMLSQNASPTHQGLVFGVSQTMMSIAQILSPLLSGYLIEKNWTMLWCITISGLSFVGLIVGRFVSTKIRHIEPLIHSN